MGWLKNVYGKWIAGDLGQTDWTMSTLGHVAAYDYDVLLFAGDLSYADYIQSRWDTFGQMMSPYANYKPWMVTEGNHEKESLPLLVESFLAYNTRWEMPYKESGSNSNLYYSFEVAGVHVLMLGSYTDFDTESEQYKWLQVVHPCLVLSPRIGRKLTVLWILNKTFDALLH